MVMLVLGLALVVGGVVLLLVHVGGGIGVGALVVGIALVLASMIRRRGRRVSSADAAVLSSINS